MKAPPLFLVMPPQVGLLAGFATGLMCLRRHVERRLPNQRVEIIDLSNEEDGLVDERLTEIKEAGVGSAIFGVTTTTATYQAALHVAQAVKSLFGDKACVIFGGHHASADADMVLQSHREVDYVIAGEGEAALLAFLKAWPDVEETPGLIFRAGNRIVRNGAPPPLAKEELDQLTVDERWFIEPLCAGKFEHFTYVSARGCPLKCKFCSVANQKIRGKSPSVIAEEVRAIVRKGYRRIAIEDNFFAHSPKRTREVCEALRALKDEGLDFNWDCQTRVEAAARDGVAAMLAEAGCDAAYLGVEALTEKALDFLGKATDAERYVRTLREVAAPALFDAGLAVYINLQFGLPEEAGSGHRDMIEILRGVGAVAAERDSVVTVFPQLFVLYPGTEHWRMYRERGAVRSDLFETYTTWELDEVQLKGWMGRHFAHGVGGAPLGLLNRDKLKANQFELNQNALIEVADALTAVADLEGVEVFRYAKHLAPLPVANSAIAAL